MKRINKPTNNHLWVTKWPAPELGAMGNINIKKGYNIFLAYKGVQQKREK